MNIYQSNIYRSDLSCLYFNNEPKVIERWQFYQIVILPDTIVRIYAVDREDLKPYWESEKTTKKHFSR